MKYKNIEEGVAYMEAIHNEHCENNVQLIPRLLVHKYKYYSLILDDEERTLTIFTKGEIERTFVKGNQEIIDWEGDCYRGRPVFKD